MSTITLHTIPGFLVALLNVVFCIWVSVRQNRTPFGLMFLGVLAGASSWMFIELYFHPGVQFTLLDTISILLIYGSSLYAAGCEVLKKGWARRLTAQYGDRWVKALDYPYLLFGALGLVISINKMDFVVDRVERLSVIGPTIVVTAVVIRLVKTRADIAGWGRINPGVQQV